MAVNIFFRGRERYVRVSCDQMAPQVQPQRKHKMILGSMIPVAPLEHSLPVASVLTGSDRRSLVRTPLPAASVLRVPNSLPVASVLRVPNSLPVAARTF